MTNPTPAARLMPCPFCNKSASVRITSSHEDDREDEGNAEYFAVVCDASRPVGPGGCGAQSGFELTQELAVEAWNRRAAPAAQPPLDATMQGKAAWLAEGAALIQKYRADPIALRAIAEELLKRAGAEQAALEVRPATVPGELVADSRPGPELDGAVRFAGLVLAEHRNDGHPRDVDGDFMQQAALDCGLIEEFLAEEPCHRDLCTCAESASAEDWPMKCYHSTEAGRAAIAKGKAP